MSEPPTLPNVGGPWAAHRQSFRIEVPCNISCNISRRIDADGPAGHDGGCVSYVDDGRPAGAHARL